MCGMITSFWFRGDTCHGYILKEPLQIFLDLTFEPQATNIPLCRTQTSLSLTHTHSKRGGITQGEEGERMPGAGWAAKLPTIASRVYFLLIILQIPLFRVPCRSGLCTTPMAFTSSQLISSDVFPTVAVKALLYPGAVVDGLISTMTIPRWNDILDLYNLTAAKNASAIMDLQRLEVLAGSYFSVAGAFVGLMKPGRMSMFGTLLVVWGLVKESFLGKPPNTDPATAVFIYPTMVLALFCAFSSVKYDLNKVTKKQQARPVAKPLQSSAKSKLK